MRINNALVLILIRIHMVIVIGDHLLSAAKPLLRLSLRVALTTPEQFFLALQFAQDGI